MGEKEMTAEFELPWPPSVNHYYRHVGPRVLISRDGRKYREIVATIAQQSGAKRIEGPIAMYGEFYPPDRRRRDLDNVGGKALIDALQCAGLFQDDSQIKRIHLEMHEPVENGLCVVKIESMENAKNQNELRNMRKGDLSVAVSAP